MSIKPRANSAKAVDTANVWMLGENGTKQLEKARTRVETKRTMLGEILSIINPAEKKEHR